MMKKLKALILASILCLSTLAVACGGGGTSGSSTSTQSGSSQSESSSIDSSSVDDTPKAGDVGVILEGDKVLMNGFEYFDRDVQLLRMFNEFGVLSDNTEEAFIRTGEHSLKITPLGHRLHTANPYFLLPSSSLRFSEVAFGDFSDVDTVSMWFYNNEETDVNVGIGFGTGVMTMADRRDMIRKTNVEYFSLKHGWNYIEYNVEPAYLTLQGLKIAEVYGIVVEFDYVQSHKLADSPEVYLDDVCLTYTETPKTQNLVIDVKKGVTKDGNEYWSIADFENPLEAYYFAYGYSYPSPASAFPVMKTVFAGDYDTVATSGTQAFLIQKKHGGTSYGWPTVRLHESVMQQVIAAIGDDLLQNPQNYVFKVDIYNASSVANGCSIEFEGAQTWDSISVEPGQWKTYETTFGKINSKKLPATEKVYTEDIGIVDFRWSRYNTDENLADRPMLFDNVRIEKIVAEEE